jgi:hypothetical protein
MGVVSMRLSPGVGVFFLFPLFSFFSLPSFANETPDVGALIAKSTCAAQTKDLLESWKTRSDWTVAPGDIDGGKSFMSPTDKVGVWIGVSAYPDGSVQCVRYSSDLTIQVSWKKADCTPQETAAHHTHPKVAHAQYFTDADLEKAISGDSQALIYVWSPHMPLSVKGFPEAQGVAKKLGIKFIPVLDPEADAKTVTATIKKHSLPANAARREDSVELAARQVNLHFPSTLVVSHGKFSRLYPGHWVSLNVYENFIKENLK